MKTATAETVSMRKNLKTQFLWSLIVVIFYLKKIIYIPAFTVETFILSMSLKIYAALAFSARFLKFFFL